jgi:FolB domain-containing protein
MQLIFKEFRTESLIGIYPNEREQKQTLLIDLIIDFDGSKAEQSDDIADTLDYDNIAKIIDNISNHGKFQLLEALSSEIIKNLKREYKIINKIEIEITKPGIIAAAKRVSISNSDG